MRVAPTVDHGGRAVVAHPCSTEEVAVVPHGHGIDGVGTGFGERFGGPLDAPGGGATRVLAHPVGDLRRGDPGAVDQGRREFDPVLDVGEVLAQHDPARAPAEAGPHVLVVLRAESGAAAQPERDGERSAGGRQAPLRAAEEAAVGIGARELQRLDLAAEMPLPAAQVVVEVPVDHRAGMHHEPSPDQAGRVGEAVGRARVRGEQEETRGADAVGRATARRPRPRSVRSPSASSQVAPRAPPRPSISMRRTRAPVTRRAPAAIAPGQWVTSVDPLAPSLHPEPQVPRWTQACRPSRSADRIALYSGHQCQPSRACARARARPARPMGSGGSGGSALAG